jgi:aspartate kinase
MYGVDIRVLLSPSIGESTGGTLVTTTGGDIADLEKTSDARAVAIKKGVSCINIFGIPNEPGKADEIFSVLETINVVEIAQSQGGQTAQISILLETEVAEKVFPKLEKIGTLEATLNKNLAAISLIDPAMKETPGYLGRLTRALGNSQINIEIITTSQNSITVGVVEEGLPKAALALAQEFDLLSS